MEDSPNYIDITGCEFRREAFTEAEWEELQITLQYAKKVFEDVEKILIVEGKCPES